MKPAIMPLTKVTPVSIKPQFKIVPCPPGTPSGSTARLSTYKTSFEKTRSQFTQLTALYRAGSSMITTASTMTVSPDNRRIGATYYVKPLARHQYEIFLAKVDGADPNVDRIHFKAQISPNGSIVRIIRYYDMSYMDNLHTTYTIGRDPKTKKFGMDIVHENNKGKLPFIEQHGKIFPILNAEMAWYLGLFVIGLEKKDDADEWEFVTADPEGWEFLEFDGEGGGDSDGDSDDWFAV